MIQSMTGFGKAIQSIGDKRVRVEIKSLNSRYMDFLMKISPLYKSREMALRQYLAEKLHRGKIEVTINVDEGDELQSFSINKNLIKKYYNELAGMCDDLDLSKKDLMNVIIRIPDVTTPSKTEASDEEWQEVMKIVDQAISAFEKFRKMEGANLLDDIYQSIDIIQEQSIKVESMIPERLELIKERLEQTLRDFIAKEKINNNRFEQELLYYLEKLDVNEEMVRLKSHCDYFLSILHNNALIKGKKLSFIAQEIGREINTISAKANHANIQTTVVQMKDELEKIKEQLMNVV